MSVSMISCHSAISQKPIAYYSAHNPPILVLLKIAFSCCLQELFLTTVTFGLLIKDLNLHLNFCKAALWQRLLLKVLYNIKLNWKTELNTYCKNRYICLAKGFPTTLAINSYWNNYTNDTNDSTMEMMGNCWDYRDWVRKTKNINLTLLKWDLSMRRAVFQKPLENMYTKCNCE